MHAAYIDFCLVFTRN